MPGDVSSPLFLPVSLSGRLFLSSQSDWQLRLGCSVMENYCLPVLRLRGVLTPLLCCHASLTTVLQFPQEWLWSLSLLGTVPEPSAVLGHILWSSFFQSRLVLMYICLMQMCRRTRWLILPTHLLWITTKKSYKPYTKEMMSFILHTECEDIVTMKGKMLKTWVKVRPLSILGFPEILHMTPNSFHLKPGNISSDFSIPMDNLADTLASWLYELNFSYLYSLLWSHRYKYYVYLIK